MSDPIEQRLYIKTPSMPDAVLPLTGTELAEVWQGDAETGGMVKIQYNLLQGNPVAHKASHELNGSDQLGNNNPAANTHVISDSSGKVDAWVSDGTTLVKGKVQFATDGESVSAKALQANDERLTNARTPTSHGSTHNSTGSDPISDLPTTGQKAAMAGSYGTPGDSNRYVTETDPAFSAISPVINTSVTYTVGTGGDYATLNAAIENVTLKFPQYKLSGVRVTLQLLTGFVMAEQLIVDGKDLGWITITAVDSSVSVTPASITVTCEGALYAIVGVNHATLPKISAQFTFGTYQSTMIGIGALNCSSVVVDGGGFNYAIRGLSCKDGSSAFSTEGIFQYCGRGICADYSSHISTWLCDVSNYVTSGIYANISSFIAAPNLVCTTSGGNGISEVIGGSIIYTGDSETADSQQQNIMTGQGIIFNATKPSITCRARASIDGTTAANVSGTYAISGTTCTITIANHGYIVGHKVYADFTSGTGVDGLYTITGVTANTFAFTHASATTSGNVTLNRRAILGSANIHSVTFISTGRYWLNFIFQMTDSTYAQTNQTLYTSGVYLAQNDGGYPKTVYGCSVLITNTGGTAVNLVFDVAVFD